MFENNRVEKRLLKRKSIMDSLEKAKEEGISWKINQLESLLNEGKKYLFDENNPCNFHFFLET